MAKAALPTHTDAATEKAKSRAAELADCPVLDGTARTQYREAVKAANGFSLACLDFLQKKTPEEQAAWLKVTVDSSRAIFQPWSMEILYTIAVMRRARFSDLHNLLGMSTRTLSDKLKSLREAGLIEREVFDESPVRIEYYLTKHGGATAALAAPLFGHLNLQALREAGQI